MAGDGARVGVDVGGTFTDLVALVDGKLVTAKVPVDARRPVRGRHAAFEARRLDRARPPSRTARRWRPTRCSSGAAPARRSSRREGFRDVLEIGRQARADLYDLTAVRPPPLVPRELRFTVRERMGPDGELEPLTTRTSQARRRGGARGRGRGGRRVPAVRLPAPRARARVGRGAAGGAAGRARLALAPTCCRSSASTSASRPRRPTRTSRRGWPPTCARWRERAARGRPAGAARDAVLRRRRGRRRRRPSGAAGCVLSGPAGGVVGAAFVARAGGYEDLLTFDMGGTSTDVAPIVGGEARHHDGVRGRRRAGRAARWSTCTPCAPAAARSRGPTRAARCASARSRRAPTRARRPTAAAARSRR